MRKTSIFFLLISIVLVFGGFKLRDKAVADAEKKDIELFTQEITENGDLVETVEFKPEEINRIIIAMKDVNVNIIGGADRCYAEIVNFNALEYSAFTSNKAFNVNNDLLSSIIGRAESGKIKFNGIRNYVRNDDYNTEKAVNIYLSNSTVVKQFNIKLEKGNVTVQNMGDLICDYTVTINSGDLTVTNTKQISLIKADIKNGNVSISDSYVVNSEINIDNGNFDITSPTNIIYNYNIENEAGDIKINSEIFKGTHVVENETPNGLIEAHIGVGNVTVLLVDKVEEQPQTSENADTANTTETPVTPAT